MNHPQHDVVEEIHRFADLGMEFVDLTLEPPAASSWLVDPDKIRHALDSTGLDVVGHTSYYLPLESPFEEVRQGALAEFRRCIRIFSEVGARWMNIHPGRYTPMHPRAFFIQRNLESLRELHEFAAPLGVGLMVENIPGDFNTPEELADLLDPMPELGLHLDIGHCNIQVSSNTTGPILQRFGDRLRHLHLHDNDGRGDQHLPLGAGKMDIEEQVRHVRRAGYDGMITLEVFSKDKTYLLHSIEVLRRLWAETSP